jgi:hypothetical protein
VSSLWKRGRFGTSLFYFFAVKKDSKKIVSLAAFLPELKTPSATKIWTRDGQKSMNWLENRLERRDWENLRRGKTACAHWGNVVFGQALITHTQ